ncbi:glycosyltransferase family 2 protein [Tropicibacter sp. Alg240-R139]|uniref:glycosyltransferase family 2 protein n=1 Tax=Tropicibacter sp. Alg240-R139 TaxID=2305991 RepID=UPI0013DEDEFA|nr:glycosyltransferase family 2 protein [Tropicibacter sp. Alg240-R139]
MTATWRVGAILNETLADTLRFAAWYLEAGADGLTLMFDNPRDPAIGVLEADPKVTCIPCTPEFWEGLGLTQDTRFPKRQNFALSHIYRTTSEDWLLNVDADEFVYVDEGRITDLLSAQAAETEAIRIETAEIVEPLVAQDTLTFRLPMERDVARRVYVDNAELFGPRRKGLVGHPQGKSATRTGIEGVSLRQHWPQRRNGEPMVEHMIGRQDGAYLLHFIGLDYDAWHGKLAWRAGSRGFTVPLTHRIETAMGSENADVELQELHARLHKASPELLKRLQAEGARLDLQLNFDTIARRVFGDAFPG